MLHTQKYKGPLPIQTEQLQMSQIALENFSSSGMTHFLLHCWVSFPHIDFGCSNRNVLQVKMNFNPQAKALIHHVSEITKSVAMLQACPVSYHLLPNISLRRTAPNLSWGWINPFHKPGTLSPTQRWSCRINRKGPEPAWPCILPPRAKGRTETRLQAPSLVCRSVLNIFWLICDIYQADCI